MKKNKRLLGKLAEGEKISDAAKKPRRKDGSVLVQRAVIFTAATFLIAVLFGSPAYHLSERHSALQKAKSAANLQMDELQRVLAEHTGERIGDLEDCGFGAGLDTALNFYGGYTSKDEILADEFFVDRGQAQLLSDAWDGEIRYRIVKYDGKEYLRAAKGMDIPNESSARSIFTIDLATDSFGGSRVASLIGLLTGFVAACALSIPLKKWILMPSVKEIADLRDVAVKVSGGDFDAHASESAPDEMGELGAALNHLSYQLSRNMYMLIVERNRLKHMLDGLSEGIIAIDSNGQITHINPAIGNMFEQKRISVGLPDARMKHVPDESVWKDFDSVIKTGEASTRNLSIRDMTIRIVITPIVDEIGAIAGAVGLFSDITQSERLERTRREYVSNVSHELRTPLTAVRALIEPLKEGMVTKEEDRMRYYDIILREVMRLSRLINDQLELSRLQSGGVAIEKKRMPLDDLIYDVCDRYSSIAEEHGLTLNIESDLSDLPSVYANADRVEQMLIILLDNAIKYTEKGGVSVKVDWDAEKVNITVKDSGIGIAEEDLPYVFDRFYKVDKAHSGKGSGLGLSIAKELLNRMNEDISVTSVKGEGSAFSFTVHRNPTDEEIRAEAVKMASGESR